MTKNMNTDFDSLVPGRTLDRRSFIATAIGAGFALAVQPAAGQSPVVTDPEGLVAGEVKISTGDGDMPAYRARPEKGEKLPVILVVSEIFGVHAYIQDICRRLAKLGYLAIAPELFARQGDPRQLASIPEIMSQIVARVPDAQVMADLDASVAWAGRNGGDATRLGITGFCWGGRITWLYCARNPQLKAGVAWYGRLVGEASALTPRHPIDVATELKAPVLGLYGDLDAGIPLDTIARMEKALQAATNAASRASTIHVYPDAPHAFHADYRPSYRKEAAEDGWQRLRTWFKDHGL